MIKERRRINQENRVTKTHQASGKRNSPDSLNVITTSFGKGSSEMEPSLWSFYSNKRLKCKRSNSIQKLYKLKALTGRSNIVGRERMEFSTRSAARESFCVLRSNFSSSLIKERTLAS